MMCQKCLALKMFNAVKPQFSNVLEFKQFGCQIENSR